MTISQESNLPVITLKPRIGIDGRTFYHTGSTARGIGHYAFNHLKHTVELRPDWQFVIYVEEDKVSRTMERLTVLPNVRIRQIDDYRPEEVDLFHIPDPMNMTPGFDSPMRFCVDVPSTAILYDITPLRFYWKFFSQEGRKAYQARLAQFQRRGVTLLAISEFSRQDLLQATPILPEKVITIMAGLNRAEKAAEITPALVKEVRSKYGITAPFFLHVGALDPHKNFAAVLKVIGRVRSRDGIQLVVVGEKENHLKAYSDECDRKKIKDILFPGYIPRLDLEVLYHETIALLFLSWYEGFGFPVLEAMAQGCPVISTNVTSIPEVAGDAALLFAPDDYAAIGRGMQDLLDNRTLRETLRAKGLVQSAKFPWLKPAQKTIEVWEQILGVVKTGMPAQPEKSCGENIRHESEARISQPVVVSWEGSFLDHGSLSHVNRELTGSFKAVPDFQINCVANGAPAAADAVKFWPVLAGEISATPSPDTAVTVRHAWPPDWKRPRHGKLAVIQPWEFGSLPEDWVRRARDVDEFWVPSNFVRNCYIESGIAAQKVVVVPNGVRAEKFHPQVPPMKLATQKKFKFLFVGGTIGRKGPDLLLQAYLKNFTAADEVCLVIKDFGGKSVYAGQTFQSQIHAAQSFPNAPEILYLNEELSPDTLPGLYTACDCLVLPYRGEGFGLPALEAMACGLPVIVTAGGATDDFVRDEFAWRIPAERNFFGNEVSGMKLAGTGWLLEPNLDALGEKMRRAFENPDGARERGKLASRHAHQFYSWKNAAAIVAQRIRELAVGQTAPAKLAKTAPVILPSVAQVGQLNETRELFRQKKFQLAWQSIIGAVAKRPFHPEAFLLLAEIALAAGDSVSARMCAQRARDCAPGWSAPKQFLKKPLRGNAKSEWLKLPEQIGNRKSEIGNKLSVCLIVKNEEKFLAQCLKSVRTLARQIIVVDTGSTDRTVEIAKEFGAEIYSFAWCDDFSAARNAALEHATGDWILMLDADEELPETEHEKIRANMKKSDVIAYRLPLVNREKENEGQSFVPRLFRNAPGVYYSGRIHEQVFPSLMALGKPWGLATRFGTAQLLHHGYTKEIIRDRNKIERNLKLLRQAVEENPTDANLRMNFGLELVRSDDLAGGVAKYREAFELMSAQATEETAPELREVLLTQFTCQLYKIRAHEEVVRVLHSPLAKKSGLTASLHFALGLSQFELKNYGEAAKQMQQCLAKRKQPALSPINTDILTAAPEHCLALSLAKLGDAAGAEKIFQKILAEPVQNNSENVKLDYAKFLAGQNCFVEALQKLHEMVAANARNTAAWRTGGEIALGRAEFLEFARDWTGEAMRYVAEDLVIVAQRAEALMFSGDTAAAMELWEQIWNAERKPRFLAALILCETIDAQTTHAPDDGPEESATSRAFIQWYKKLIALRAKTVVGRVNEQTEKLSRALPTAARMIETALAETRVGAVVTS
jgi:glycosyltransferase involved in cell wall biosynthesis/tetratricopeptide (TPR) repeat protein